MRYFFLIFFLNPVLANSQDNLDFGKVRADSHFNCFDIMVKDSFYFGVHEICDSKNELEIRLKSFYRPQSGKELIVLSYTNTKWDIKRYMIKSGMVGQKLEITSFIMPYLNDKFVDATFKQLFDTLKTNGVFLLPNQSELGHELPALDGTLYVITYKAGNKFRSYRYENPETYMEKFPDKVEYRGFKTIILALKNFFE